MERIYAQERPALKEDGRAVNPVTKTTLINFDVQEEKDCEKGKFSYLQVEMYPSQMDYRHVVSAIIRSKYDDDRMQAVQNNYMANPADDDAYTAFFEMQDWRKYAKQTAKEALDINE